MRKRWIALILLLVTVAAGTVLVANRSKETPNPKVLRYEVSGLVVETAVRGPVLCLGPVTTSIPPGCGDQALSLVGWDWDNVADERRASGVTYGDYRVLGTYDGTSFTATGKPQPPRQEKGVPFTFPTPCPEPEGGWPHPKGIEIDDMVRYEQTMVRVDQAMRAQPDFTVFWLAHGAPGAAPPQELSDPSSAVLTAGFTGDLARHEAEMRSIWPGGVCVFKTERTKSQLDRIASDARGYAERLGRRVLFSDPDDVHGIVELTLIAARDGDGKRFEKRFGKDVVRIKSILKPVSAR